MASDVGKAVGVGVPATIGAGIGFLAGGPVGALIGAGLGALLGIMGVGAVEEKERQAIAQTDPFLQEKREVIKRLLQMSPYLPDMSYSDFAKMLESENKKKDFDISSLILSSLFPFNPLINAIGNLFIMKSIDDKRKGGRKG